MMRAKEIKDKLENELQDYVNRRTKWLSFFLNPELTETKIGMAVTLLNDIKEAKNLLDLREMVRIFQAKCKYVLPEIFPSYSPNRFEEILENALKEINNMQGSTQMINVLSTMSLR